MERKYVGFHIPFGNPKVIVNQICTKIKKLNLSRELPVVKVEKKARIGEFYIFLGVIYSKDPYQITKNIFPQKPFGLFNLEEIKPMVSKPDIETYNINSLSYKSLEPLNLGDPFELSDFIPKEEFKEDYELSDRYDRLLYWLSAAAEGTWESFVKTCNILQLAEEPKYARSIFRKMRLLGHIECSKDGLKWSICPPALVQSPTNKERAFLCGKRIPKTMETISKYFKIHYVTQPKCQGPTCIEIEFKDSFSDNYEKLPFKFVGPVAIKTSFLLPDIYEWKDNLSKLEKFDIHSWEIEKWDSKSKSFSSCHIYYDNEKGKYNGEVGMYRFNKKNGANQYKMLLFLDISKKNWIKTEWHGLRFLADHISGMGEVFHKSENNEVGIFYDNRWPLLYEKMLVLSSGFLPQINKNYQKLQYRDIPVELAKVIGEKLNLTLKVI